MSRIHSAIEDLKNVAKTLKRLEGTGIGLADAAQGLRRVSNVLGVALGELEAHERRLQALDDDLGDHLLMHEKEDSPHSTAEFNSAELQEWLMGCREDRKKEAGG